MPTHVEVVEVRVYRGPNLYFPRPAVRLIAEVPGWLRASSQRTERIAETIGIPLGAGAGPPGSEQRRRAVARIAAQVARGIARASATRLAVRGRTGPGPDQILVVFPWRRRGTAEALARETAEALRALLTTRRSWDGTLAEPAQRVNAVEPGVAPEVPVPSVPVIAVTGTNGKTTTVRMLAHVLRGAGRSVAYSSTDGVYHDGVLIEAGDYSGFAGAGMALAQPGVDVVVLETARGGILLQGIGTAHNDVAVVTNVSRDHLGLHGIETLDQLAEVKATITRITRPEGWVVLNADDPRVLAMRRGSPARPFLFSVDAGHPAFREVLGHAGRAATVLDGSIVVLGRRARARSIVPIEDVPSTLAGIAGHYVQNALAVTAAAFAVGMDAEVIGEGLRTFVPDADTNPGRANIYTLDGRIVVVDYAHNEAGIEGLTGLLRGLRRPGAAIWLAFGTAGDRSDDILHEFSYRAGRGADHPVIAELPRYLRGRAAADIVARLRAGALDGGATEVPDEPDEVHALERMLRGSRDGDVVGITALAQRPEIFALLEAEGAARADPATVRRLVRMARVPTT